MIILYNMVLLTSILVALPLIAVRIISSQKARRTVSRRVRLRPFVKPSIGTTRKPIWVHALSVGEVLASAPLLGEIREVYPGRPVVLSVSTVTGNEIAKKSLEDHVASVFFLPYDVIWHVRRIIRHVEPSVFLLVESDIWPNFLYEMKRQKIPAVLINGRISPRSLRGYMRISFFMRRVFSWLSAICVQTETDAERFIALGALADKVHITGNTKFDQHPASLSHEEISRMKASLGIRPGRKIFLAGSTHSGEEAMLLRCFDTLKRSHPDLTLVVAPRDPARAHEIRNMYEQVGFSTCLRTELPSTNAELEPGVIIIDTVGELRHLYGIADVVFVGKSMVNLGGQNPLEAAALKKPILFGPYMFNFRLIAHMLVEAGGAVQVENEGELFEQAERLLFNPEHSNAMGMNAYRVFEMNRGAVQKTLAVIERFL